VSEQPSSLILRPSSPDSGTRLDAYLTKNIEGWSRARLSRLIESGDVLVNGSPAKSSYKVRENDEIDVELTEYAPTRFEPENIPLDIVFEDEHLAVINKPAGMVVHPGAGVSSGTLANAVAYHFLEPLTSSAADSQRGEPPASAGGSSHRIGIVHRLDKDTSGLIVVAKSEEISDALSEQFREREVFKSYVALVHGALRENSGKIETPIAREKFNRVKMAVSAHGRHALSLWRVRKRFEKFTLLDVEIKTGRTHQIRVHLASINHPVVGDETYNAGRDKTVADIEIRKAVHDLGRFFLHAERLAFTHPKTDQHLEFRQELPKELKQFLDLLMMKAK